MEQRASMSDPEERRIELTVVVVKIICSASDCAHREILGHCQLLEREWEMPRRVGQGTALGVVCHSYTSRP